MDKIESSVVLRAGRAITARAAVMLVFPGTETSDDREFTVYKKERCNPPVPQNQAKHLYIQSITRIPIDRQFTVPTLRCPDELVGSCLNSFKRRGIPSS